ncbi:MOSC domain-containing protein [soil metagenome]
MSQVLSVNVGIAKPLHTAGDRVVLSAIVKSPVTGPVAVHWLGLEGDEQADHSVHGGPQKAVYAYPSEHYAFWNTLRRQSLRPEGSVVQPGLIPYAEIDDLPPGAMGENLTTSGLDERTLFIGDRLAIGSVEALVVAPREPCFKFNARMSMKHAARMMVQSGFCGFYLQVMREGRIEAGDAVTVMPGDRLITVAQAFSMRMNRRP